MYSFYLYLLYYSRVCKIFSAMRIFDYLTFHRFQRSHTSLPRLRSRPKFLSDQTFQTEIISDQTFQTETNPDQTFQTQVTSDQTFQTKSLWSDLSDRRRSDQTIIRPCSRLKFRPLPRLWSNCDQTQVRSKMLWPDPVALEAFVVRPSCACSHLWSDWSAL